MHVEKQPFALRAEQREILEMQRLREPVELQQLALARGWPNTSSGDTARSSGSCARSSAS
jgi:hypothetical protein